MATAQAFSMHELVLVPTPRSPAQSPMKAAVLGEPDPLAAGELGLITHDLAYRTGATTGLLVVCNPDDRQVHVVYACGVAHEPELLSTSSGGDRGFVGQVLDSGDAAVGAIDPQHDRSLGFAVCGAPVRYAAGAAVRPPGGPPGALCIGFATPPPRHDQMLTRWMVEHYAALASLYMHDAGVLDGLLAAGRLDGLTGCLNHTAIRSELQRELERSARNARPLSCCFIDLDRFKQINDSYGHPHGSAVLANVAAVLRDCIRLGDTLGRYGGDEFVAILPDTDQTAAIALAQRLQSTISTTTLNRGLEQLGASIGVAQARPGCTADELLAAADNALLRAKGAGRGLVVGASDPAGY